MCEQAVPCCQLIEHSTTQLLQGPVCQHQHHYDRTTARYESEVLLAHILQCERTDFYLYPQRLVGPSDQKRFYTSMQRRQQAEPVAYITGSAAFYREQLAVNAHTLIPRSESEGIIDLAKDYTSQTQPPTWILDIGTGSGCLAIASAHVFRHAQVEAWDISPAALDMARKNVAHYGLDERIHLYQRDMRLPHSWLQAPAERQRPYFDLVISTPPYVKRDDPEVSYETRMFEPAVALYGGDDGLDFYRCLACYMGHVSAAQKTVIILEVGYDQADAVCEMMRAKISGSIDVMKDIEGKDRYICIRYGYGK